LARHITLVSASGLACVQSNRSSDGVLPPPPEHAATPATATNSADWINRRTDMSASYREDEGANLTGRRRGRRRRWGGTGMRGWVNKPYRNPGCKAASAGRTVATTRHGPRRQLPCHGCRIAAVARCSHCGRGFAAVPSPVGDDGRPRAGRLEHRRRCTSARDSFEIEQPSPTRPVTRGRPAARNADRGPAAGSATPTPPGAPRQTAAP
jgi:hypothetical protein